MSNAHFVECLSSDPFIQNISRRAIRVLNDPSLARPQRVTLIHRIQQELVEYQAEVNRRAWAVAAKANGLAKAAKASCKPTRRDVVAVRCGDPMSQAMAKGQSVVPVIASNDATATRRRAVLTLKR